MMLKKLLADYFDAFSNLYGIIPMRKAYSIIEKQNPELNLTKEKFAETVAEMDLNDVFYFILSEDELYDEDADDCDLFEKLLIAEYLVIFDDYDDFENLRSEQEYKPYYIPEKEELLKYSDQFYFEKTKQFCILENFLRDELKITNYNDLAEEFVTLLSTDECGTVEIISEMKRISRPKFKKFANEQEMVKFFELYANFRNHMRKHAHRGNTSFEMDDCLYADFYIEDFKQCFTTEPSKNGKCPCGSGKKFKRCCMGKGIYD